MFGNSFLLCLLQWHFLPCYRLTIFFKGRMLSVCECVHIFPYLVVGYLSVDLCRADIAVPEHLAERLHRNTIGKTNRGRECVASHVKGQAFLYPAYLPDVHTRKGCFSYCEIGEYQVVRFLVLDIERKDLFGNGQERNNRLYIRFLPFDAYFLRAVSIMDDMLRFEPLHIHTSQTGEGTEKE